MTTTRADIAPQVPPPGRPGAPYWDPTDDRIYQCLFVEYKSVAATAREIGLDRKTIRDRRRKMMLKVPVEDIELHRTAEDTRLEHLVEEQARIARFALDPERESFNLDMAHRALKEIHQLTKTRIDLFGLAQPVADPGPDAESLNDLFAAYNVGRADAQQESI